VEDAVPPWALRREGTTGGGSASDATQDTGQGEAMTDSALRQALERVTANFRLMLAGKPVRDVSETLAECEAALAAPVEQQVHADLLRLIEKLIESAIDSDASGRPEGSLYRNAMNVRAALGGLLPVVQPGWKLVPVEPTPEMVNAGFQAWDDFDRGLCEAPGCVWDAMLAAAPKAQG
jgi:hypothetical protein